MSETQEEFPGCLAIGLKEALVGEQITPIEYPAVKFNVNYKCGVDNCELFGSLALSSETAAPTPVEVDTKLCKFRDAWKSANLDIDI